MIGIIDYGMGNLYSVRNAFLSLGKAARIISQPRELLQFRLVVLPGVGSFGDAMAILNKSGLTSAIRQYIRSGRILLGICLGVQLFFESSQESPGIKGLGIIKGNVVRFRGDIKIPHIGWNQLRIAKQHPLLAKVEEDFFVYFCHSYYVKPKDSRVILCTTEHGKEFVSVVAQDNVMGLQFHPEKSQQVGLKILENFTRL